MGRIRELGRIWQRDHKVLGVPSSGVNLPSKAEGRDVFDEIADNMIELGDQIVASAAGIKEEGTWAALSAIVGSTVGQPGRSLDTGGGTHTDPVVGGTVPNEGEFTWSESPAGWKYIGPLLLAGKATQDEAEAGVVDNKAMTPLQTKTVVGNAADALVDRQDYFGGESGIAMTDDGGYAALIATDQRFETPTFKATATAIVHPAFQAVEDAAPEAVETWTESGVAFTDANGNSVLTTTGARFETPVFQATATAIVHPAFQSVQNDVEALLPSLERWAKYAPLTMILQIIIWGQSLALGGDASEVAISTTDLTDALMFNGGTRWPGRPSSNDGGFAATQHASLVALKEGVTVNTETPAYGIAQMIAQLFLADQGISLSTAGHQLLLSSPGEVSSTAAQLSSTGLSWNRLVADLEYGKSLADAAGSSISMAAMPIIQGEANTGVLDNDVVAWKQQWRKNKAAAVAAYQSAQGSAREFITPIYQLAKTDLTSMAMPLAQLELAEEDGWCLATPMYFMPYVADEIHVDSIGSKWLGAYIGRAIYRWMFKGDRPRPLRPYRADRIGNSVILPFPISPGRRLAWDTDYTPAIANKGFELVDSAGDNITIDSVHLVGLDKVELKCSAPVPDGAVVRYAHVLVAGGNTRPAGNLRDNDPLVFDPAGINVPMYTFAPIFTQEVL